VRRVAVDWPAVGHRISSAWKRTPRPTKEAEVPATIQQLARAKQEVRAEQLPPLQGPVDLGDSSGPPKPPVPGPAAKPPMKPEELRPAPAESKPEAGAYLNRLLDAKKKSQQKPKE
ncbi:MAG TPA: hypothetical protein VMU54_05255, partial [Planctomycetota bacterium]|nr:hypothetical protein [Planctomycetota bacterium]